MQEPAWPLRRSGDIILSGKSCNLFYYCYWFCLSHRGQWKLFSAEEVTCQSCHIFFFGGGGSSRSGKSHEFYFSQGKFKMSDLIPLRAGRNIRTIWKICWKQFSAVNERVKWMAVSWGQKPLLDLTFCIYSVKEMLFLSGKSRGILKRDACCNHDSSTRLTSDTSLDWLLFIFSPEYFTNCM